MFIDATETICKAVFRAIGRLARTYYEVIWGDPTILDWSVATLTTIGMIAALTYIFKRCHKP